MKMGYEKVTEKIYFTGVYNANVRLTDVIIPTEYGTSYNSYIIKTGGKNILVETCHGDFFDRYLENIKEICEPSEIGYIILNHTEPDHSGSLGKLLELNRDIKVVCTNAAKIYLGNITNNSEIEYIVVKDGEELELEGIKLRFIVAPFLHWPDSMFTYIEGEKVIFTCDFLGAHYCEPYVFDYNVTRDAEYVESVKNYYGAIFGPFKKYVLEGLKKISKLDIEYICTSHGPILTRNRDRSKMDYVLNNYKSWSVGEEHSVAEIPIFYCTAYGNTLRLAENIKEGILSQLAADVKLFNLAEEDINHMARVINSSDAFLIGSPTINRDTVPPVWNLLSRIDAVNCRNKNVGVFGSFGWSGEAVPFINQRLESLKMNVFSDGFKINFVPTEEDLERAKKFGADFAQLM